MSECENVQYVTESDNKLKQLVKNFGRGKRVVIKYQGDFKYVHIYDNRKEAKYPGITLGYDEFPTLVNTVRFMDMADPFFKDQPLPVESFKRRTGVMEIGVQHAHTFKILQPLPHRQQVLQEPQQQEPPQQEPHHEHMEDGFEDLDLFLSSLIATPICVPNHSNPSYPSFSSSLIATPVCVTNHLNPSYPSVSSSLIATPVCVPNHPNPSNSSVSSSLITTPVCVPNHPNPSYPSVSVPNVRKRYSPETEPVTPTQTPKKGRHVKNPGFKRHRSFPLPSLPPYKEH